MCIRIYVVYYIYIYIYIERERGREKYAIMYIYIYICICYVQHASSCRGARTIPEEACLRAMFKMHRALEVPRPMHKRHA